MTCPCCRRENAPTADFCDCGHPFTRASIARRPIAPAERPCPACQKPISVSARKCPYCRTEFGLLSGASLAAAVIGVVGLACLLAILYMLSKYRWHF
jgi:hypothetical protein